ncbi:MAG TPA: c-type cytochrome [Burkholderiaceae bacterium]|nr:c-type cytochrome [Burkholderiaceae bacterium]
MYEAKRVWALALLGALILVQAARAEGDPDLERARKIVNGGCVLCHGADGESSSELFPKLAAQNAAYLARQLAAFKSGARKSSTMQPMVKDLSEADMVSLGAYFARKPPTANEVKDRDLADVGRYIYQHGNRFSGVAPCASCHGPGGEGTETLPRLAGQNALYLENQIKLFNKRERTNDNEVMHVIAARLTELEIKAVAEYLAGKK